MIIVSAGEHEVTIVARVIDTYIEAVTMQMWQGQFSSTPQPGSRLVRISRAMRRSVKWTDGASESRAVHSRTTTTIRSTPGEKWPIPASLIRVDGIAWRALWSFLSLRGRHKQK